MGIYHSREREKGREWEREREREREKDRERVLYCNKSKIDNLFWFVTSKVKVTTFSACSRHVWPLGSKSSLVMCDLVTKNGKDFPIRKMMKSFILEFKIVYIILNSHGFVIYKGKVIYTFANYFLLFSDKGLKQQWITVKIDHHSKIYD